MMKKAKKAMVYKARKDRRRGDGKKREKEHERRRKRRITSLGHVRRGLLLDSMIVS